MIKVDVHVLHLPDEINICGDLNDPHVDVHHLDGIRGNTLQARTNGFRAGSNPYVSFVDPDDEVDLTGYKKCLDELETNPELGGVYTNSWIKYEREDLRDRRQYRDHVWELDRMRKSIPIHPMFVIRRSVMEEALNAIVNPPAYWTLAEQMIYAHCAVIAPFKYLDFVAYTWYDRIKGGHTNSKAADRKAVRKYIDKLLDDAQS